MFFIVNLKTSNKETIIVPMKWVQGLQIVKLLNYGRPIYRKSGVLVYYSKDFDEEPNFKKIASKDFQPHEPACYHAGIVKAFRKILFIIYIYLFLYRIIILISRNMQHFAFTLNRFNAHGIKSPLSVVSYQPHAAIWRSCDKHSYSR